MPLSLVLNRSLVAALGGGGARDTSPADFSLSNNAIAEDATIGGLVGNFAFSPGPKRPVDFALSNNSIAEDAAIGTVVGIFSFTG